MQTAGTGNWSMTIPKLVFNQAAELGSGRIAAVSAASQAEVR